MSSVMHRHGGLNFASPEDCPYCRIAELEQAIDSHNAECRGACTRAAATGRCKPYTSRGRECPDCPQDWKIVLARKEGEG